MLTILTSEPPHSPSRRATALAGEADKEMMRHGGASHLVRVVYLKQLKDLWDSTEYREPMVGTVAALGGSPPRESIDGRVPSPRPAHQSECAIARRAAHRDACLRRDLPPAVRALSLRSPAGGCHLVGAHARGASRHDTGWKSWPRARCCCRMRRVTTTRLRSGPPSWVLRPSSRPAHRAPGVALSQRRGADRAGRASRETTPTLHRNLAHAPFCRDFARTVSAPLAAERGRRRAADRGRGLAPGGQLDAGGGRRRRLHAGDRRARSRGGGRDGGAGAGTLGDEQLGEYLAASLREAPVAPAAPDVAALAFSAGFRGRTVAALIGLDREPGP